MRAAKLEWKKIDDGWWSATGGTDCNYTVATLNNGTHIADFISRDGDHWRFVGESTEHCKKHCEQHFKDESKLIETGNELIKQMTKGMK